MFVNYIKPKKKCLHHVKVHSKLYITSWGYPALPGNDLPYVKDIIKN